VSGSALVRRTAQWGGRSRGHADLPVSRVQPGTAACRPAPAPSSSRGADVSHGRGPKLALHVDPAAPPPVGGGAVRVVHGVAVLIANGYFPALTRSSRTGCASGASERSLTVVASFAKIYTAPQVPGGRAASAAASFLACRCDVIPPTRRRQEKQFGAPLKQLARSRCRIHNEPYGRVKLRQHGHGS
jgi:hypothetical protein